MKSLPAILPALVLSALGIVTLSGCRVFVSDEPPRRERHVYVEQAPPPPRQVVVVQEPPRQVVVVQPPREAYVYYPDVEVYYSQQRHVYYYRDHGNWREGRNLPPNVVVRGHRDVTVELEGPRPYDHHDQVRRQYGH